MKDTDGTGAKDAEQKKVQMEYLYPKKFSCPVCKQSFTNHLIKKSKLKMIKTDTDTRMQYHDIDPNMYEVIMCNRCGYAAIQTHFDTILDNQVTLLHQKIESHFKQREYPVPLSPEHAVERFKLALLCAEIIHDKDSVKAFICLKIAWIYRGIEDQTNELSFLNKACDEFIAAYSNEPFPIGSMDEPTIQFMIGELARRAGRSSEAQRWIGSVLTAPDIPKSLKDRAIEVRSLLREESK